MRIEVHKQLILTNLNSQILKTVNTISEFWSTLQVENPDLRRVYYSLSHLNSEVRRVFSMWKSQEKYFMQLPTALSNFGMFSFYLLDREQEGIQMIHKSMQIAQDQNRKAYKIEVMKRNVDLSKTSTPYAILTIDHVIITKLLTYIEKNKDNRP